MRENKRSERNLRLDCARSSDSDDVKATMFRLHFPGLEIYVCKGIKLVHHDVDIVGTDSCRKSSHSDAFILSCHRYEFARRVSELLLFEIFCDHVYTAGIADKDHVIGKFLRTEVKMEHRSVAVDYKF